MNDEQKPPQGDARYRTHRSVRCYVAYLEGGAGIDGGALRGTWYLNESAERVIYLFPGGIERVLYKTHYYTLQPPERMVEIAARHLKLDSGPFVVGGKAIYGFDKDRSFTPHPFIDITEPERRALYDAALAAL